MVFEIFRKKKKSTGMPAKADLDAPPSSEFSAAEEPLELPTFPVLEDIEKPSRGESVSDVDYIEREAVGEVEGELGEREGLELTTPIFVEAKLYKGVISDLTTLRNVIKDSVDRLQTISDLRDDREKNYDVWHKQIEDIQKKLIYADNSLFSKKR
jgi:hypothetical protein